MEEIARFPIVTGHTLNERPVTLPQDFEGSAQIVIIAFERWQYRLMAEWEARLQPLARDGIRLYQLAVMRPSYGLMRKFIGDMMRSRIANVASRASMVAVYTDLSAFSAALGISGTALPHVVLLNGDGVVRWQAHGPYTPRHHADLVAALVDLPSPDPYSSPPPTSCDQGTRRSSR